METYGRIGLLVASNTINILLDKFAYIPENDYALTFVVNNPSNLPNNNAWLLLMADSAGNTVYRHTFEGEKLHSKRVEKLTDYTRNEWGRCRNTL